VSVLDVVLVTEDALLRSALPAAVAADPQLSRRLSCVGEPGSALDSPMDAVDVVVIDVDGLPGTPADWCGATGTHGRRVLVLQAATDVGRLIGCLEAGALGFQTKDLDLPGFAAAVTAVAAGEAVVPRQMLGGLLRDLIEKRREDDDRLRRFRELTRREREVLGLLGQGSDPDGIAAELVISPQTARTHIQNILTKLDVHSRMEAVAFAHELDGAG
jgi:DNA-binding NarL/FixJ family response regulator